MSNSFWITFYVSSFYISKQKFMLSDPKLKIPKFSMYICMPKIKWIRQVLFEIYFKFPAV